MTIRWQELDNEGKPIGKAQNYMTVIAKVTDAFYRDYKVGTEFEAVWYPKNLQESTRYTYKILKAVPVQRKP